ncbi:MAG: hypothetical protein AAGH15_12790 [Myxococcota bacterium]
MRVWARWAALGLAGAIACTPDPPGAGTSSGTDERPTHHAPRGSAVGLPAVAHANDRDTLLGASGTLRAALARILADDVDPWRPEARVLVQNDAWGLWQRLSGLETAANDASLRRLAARVVRHLALPADRLAALAPAGPPLPEHLGPAEGWTELEAELPVLSHERAFGLRRLFRVLLAGPEGPAGPPRRALTSQLVAIDAEGKAHLTRLPGELEQLRFEGDTLVLARVHELDREALLAGSPPLRAAERIAHVPGLGANAFLFALDPPEPVADLPCARCHDDGTMMTLPTTRYAPGHRFPPLLAQASEEARAIFAEARAEP